MAVAEVKDGRAESKTEVKAAAEDRQKKKALDLALGQIEKAFGKGLRARADLRNEKIGYKVREHSLAKVPVIFAIGKREAEEGTVAIRRLGSQAQTIMKLDEALALLAGEATPPDVKRLG